MTLWSLLEVSIESWLMGSAPTDGATPKNVGLSPSLGPPRRSPIAAPHPSPTPTTGSVTRLRYLSRSKIQNYPPIVVISISWNTTSVTHQTMSICFPKTCKVSTSPAEGRLIPTLSRSLPAKSPLVASRAPPRSAKKNTPHHPIRTYSGTSGARTTSSPTRETRSQAGDVLLASKHSKSGSTPKLPNSTFPRLVRGHSRRKTLHGSSVDPPEPHGQRPDANSRTAPSDCAGSGGSSILYTFPDLVAIYVIIYTASSAVPSLKAASFAYLVPPQRASAKSVLQV